MVDGYRWPDINRLQDIGGGWKSGSTVGWEKKLNRRAKSHSSNTVLTGAGSPAQAEPGPNMKLNSQRNLAQWLVKYFNFLTY